MKKILIFLLFFKFIFTYCQKIELKNVTDSSQTFKGEIGGNAITMELHFDGIVDCHQYQHFVKGWYYYVKYKKKIPLTGVYDLANLYLYNFGNQQNKSSKFLHENITNLQLVAKTDSIAKVLKPKEIIILQSDYSNKKNISGNFYIENKVYPAELFTKDSRIYRFNNYLILPNNKKINTYDLLNPAGGNKLISYASDKSGNRVLLYFEEVSNFNFCGMCGASDGEKGYRILNFTNNWNFKNYEDFLIESCRENIYSTKITKNKNSKVLQFNFDKTTNSPAYILTVDMKNATVVKSK
ncbi:hypothetical protein [Chryseobacterium indoltheticum]|uniref:Uncharacterized protein n=1 Tax=Chryseobacterium indoltheticum TaxID=254 RepID=A0A381F713_9FLAO|nr:hypothetical protein [Chryseobacterium indoltheticum]AZA72720.1 hypothetical protein EG358_02640 [Chryseobacterium indoltheticum]SIP86322.1 hypothetical protein SAMN05421682_1013 [Chryseobacterium indoltheticum]SUX42315.1 Uncharacterised protein [Chryseobacterium indoltheticum]